MKHDSRRALGRKQAPLLCFAQRGVSVSADKFACKRSIVRSRQSENRQRVAVSRASSRGSDLRPGTRRDCAASALLGKSVRPVPRGETDHHWPASRDLERGRSRRAAGRCFEDLPRLRLGHGQLGGSDLDCLAVDGLARGAPGRARSRRDHEGRRQQGYQLPDERLRGFRAADLVVVVDRDDECAWATSPGSARALGPGCRGVAGPRPVTSSGRSSPSRRRRSRRRSRRRGRWPALPRRPTPASRGTTRPGA